VKPLAVELWIKDLKLAGRSKGHIRDMMHLLFNWAMRWELTPIDRNPMSLVRVKGSSKRTKLPRILTIKEFNRLLERLKEPYRTMALVALFLGPRVSEVVGLKWSDVDWDGLNISIVRSWVEGSVEDTKTEGSAKPLPMERPSFGNTERERRPLIRNGSSPTRRQGIRIGRARFVRIIWFPPAKRPASAVLDGIRFDTRIRACCVSTKWM
jgi:integrase